MITAGIDVGVENVKIVILKDGAIAGRAQGESGGAGRAATVDGLLAQALQDAGITGNDVEKTMVTGKGKFNTSFPVEKVVEPMAAVKAAQFLCPGATAVMDAGADEVLVATIKGDKVGEFVTNEKCAAGLGKFLSYMGRRLGFSPEEMGILGRPAADAARVNDGCVVFAEMDALGLLNRGVPTKDVAVAVTESAAIRASNVFVDITLPRWDKVVLVGGLAKNTAFANALSALTGVDFIVPEHAQYAGALGAALCAAS